MTPLHGQGRLPASRHLVRCYTDMGDMHEHAAVKLLLTSSAFSDCMRTEPLPDVTSEPPKAPTAVSKARDRGDTMTTSTSRLILCLST